jgi:hypothetical protein
MTVKLQELQSSSASVFYASQSQSVPLARRLGFIDPGWLYPVFFRDYTERN